MAGQEASLSIDKWKIALAVGIPTIAIGAGAYYLYRQRRTRPASDGKKGKTVELGDVSKLSPLDQAQDAKLKGNKYFKGERFDQAIKCYTDALNICPAGNTTDMSTFYQNRAAAYEKMGKFQDVIDDCTRSLQLNSKYTKALHRRAKAYDQIREREKCLEDITGVCVLENFSNHNTVMMADRVLKEVGKMKAAEKMKQRIPTIPSHTFIKSYFSSFSNDFLKGDGGSRGGGDNSAEGDPVAEEESTVDRPLSGFRRARELYYDGKYDEIVDECSAEIDGGEEGFVLQARLLRATFHMLMGCGERAVEDLNVVISSGVELLQANALIKRGSLLMQRGEQERSVDDFQEAVRVSPTNPDVYHHRGQLYLLMERANEAVADFEKCVELNPDFAQALFQLCFAVYRRGDSSSPIDAQFRSAMEKFPDCSEGYALYAQTLADQQNFEEADGYFDRAVALEPANPTSYVHKAMLKLQWKQDVDGAVKLLQRALELDDKCDFAYETLGTIEVQRGNYKQAVDIFTKAIELCRTELEMAHLYSLREASVAQIKVGESLQTMPPQPFVP